MEKQHSILGFAIIYTLLMMGCQSSEQAASKRILDVRLETHVVDGRQRLFSTFGFWILDESLRYRLVAAYRADGTLDRIRLRQLIPEANMSEFHDHVRLRISEGQISDFLLADRWLIALDPKLDDVIQRLMETIRRERKRLPPIIIPPNL
jgi:hypothetical protein